MELANLSGFRFHRYPSVLKIDSSVVKYFNSPKSFIRNSKIESLLKEADQGIESPYSLSIEWAPYSLVENSPRYFKQEFFELTKFLLPCLGPCLIT